MSEEVVQPLFLQGSPGPLFKVGEGALLLAERGLPAETLAAQIRSFAQRGLVHVRGQRGNGPTAHNLYGLSDLAVAKVLSMLTSDLSLSDNAILQAASLAMYSWTAADAQPRLGATPILAALRRTISRDDVEWTFQLLVCRGEQTGTRQFLVRLLENVKAGSFWEGSGLESQPRAKVLIALRPILLRLWDQAARAAHPANLSEVCGFPRPRSSSDRAT